MDSIVIVYAFQKMKAKQAVIETVYVYMKCSLTSRRELLARKLPNW